MALLSINAWGAVTSPLTCNFPSSGTFNSPVTLNGVSWAISAADKKGTASITYANAYSSSCIKFGSSASNSYSSATFSTDYFKNNSLKVTAVELSVMGNVASSSTLTVGTKSTSKSFTSNSWTKITLSELSETGTLSINATTGNVGFWVSYIKITFEAAPSCAAPTATSKGITTKNSQVVSWTDASGSAWDVYYSTSNTTPTTQTTATNLSQKSYTFTGLTPATKYYWWVRTNCGSGSTSSWVAGTAFTTNNVTYTDLFSEQKSGHFQPSFLALSQIVIWGFFAFFCKKVFNIR